MPSNYGDVSLNLGPDWSREKLASGHEFMIPAVGHVNGTADLHLREDPEKRHEFKWCAPLDMVAFHALRAKKYDYVKGNDTPESQWVKNPALWDWDAEGYCVYMGQRAMARDGALYFAEKAERERKEAERLLERRRRRGDYMDAEDQRTAKVLAAHGVVLTDDEGRELKPLKQRARG